MIPIFKFQRRRRLLEQPIPEGWLEAVTDILPTFGAFDDAQGRQFLSHLKILVWEKEWIGAGGLELDEPMRVAVATQAARMARGLPLDIFDRHSEFVIYPDHFVSPDDESLPGPLYGEALPYGTVVLSWPAVVEAIEYPCQGYNTVIHEMAHILDMTSGYLDGTPILHSPRDYKPWAKVCQAYFTAMRVDPENSFLDLYGAGDEAEFFAVTSEAFFGLPEVMAHRAPDLFAEFRRFYRVDPLIIDCHCESHDAPPGHNLDEDYEEMGYPIFAPDNPLDNTFF